MATVVRRARHSDKAPLMEFITTLWGGHDYIPRVWERWIRDRGAKVFVVEVDGKPVGMNRVKFLEDGNAWLEGARIHPQHRGKGLASKLGRNGIETAAQRRIGTVRLVSNSRNKSARRQVSKMGFNEISRMSLYVPRKDSRFRPQAQVRKAKLADVPRVTNVIQSSEEFRAGAGVYWDGFRAISLTPQTIRNRVREGSVYLSGDAIAVAKCTSEGGEGWRQVCFACGGAREVGRLIRHVFGRRDGKKVSERFVYIPQGSPLIVSARGAGLVRWSSFILFEHRSPNG